MFIQTTTTIKLAISLTPSLNLPIYQCKSDQMLLWVWKWTPICSSVPLSRNNNVNVHANKNFFRGALGSFVGASLPAPSVRVLRSQISRSVIISGMWRERSAHLCRTSRVEFARLFPRLLHAAVCLGHDALANSVISLWTRVIPFKISPKSEKDYRFDWEVSKYCPNSASTPRVIHGPRLFCWYCSRETGPGHRLSRDFRRVTSFVQ